MTVTLAWITPDAEARIAYMARVSNPKATPDDPYEKLISYFFNHKEYSPFEMACMCVEITTTRDISRQILRHRSLHFQELSQRYLALDDVAVFAEARLQDLKNRQNSVEITDPDLQKWWDGVQRFTWGVAYRLYKHALRRGIAKELARKLLPEGLTPTKMYVQGTIRDWLFYVGARTYEGAQKEHREVAEGVAAIMKEHMPALYEAARKVGIVP